VASIEDLDGSAARSARAPAVAVTNSTPSTEPATRPATGARLRRRGLDAALGRRVLFGSVLVTDNTIAGAVGGRPRVFEIRHALDALS
jgi:hypothetical protein